MQDTPPTDRDRQHAPTVSAEGFAGQHDIFFAAVEMTRMPMIVTDPNLPDNPIVFANAAFIELTGYRIDELVGRNCRFLQGPGTDAETISRVRNAIEKRTDIAVEILNYRKDGSAFWNALFVSPVFSPEGRLTYFFASQLDVTRRRDAEDALHQAQKMEAVGQLTGGIAHDFNNMLTVVMGNLDSALEMASEPRQRKRLEAAMEGCRRAAKLTGQLLAFARRQHLEGRPTNLNALVRNLREMAGRTLGSNIQIDLDLDPGVRLARVDGVQAEVALLNILINARDAMPEGGEVCIRTRDERVDRRHSAFTDGLPEGDYVVLSVTDTGTGIPAEILPKVMEPFFTTKDVGKGTGMGLAQVYGFMRQSNGYMKIESPPGEGTQVRLYFPATGGEVAEVASRPLRDARGGGETILLVEDNPDVMEMADTILREFGYHVIKAGDGRRALDVLSDGVAIDMLFSDIVMPGGVNGVTLANEALRRKPGIRVLLTTGWADRALEHGDDRAGFEVIQKPYRRDDLARKVRAILDGPSGV